ncbi:MAG: hypothetical protein KAJ64_05120, partial [Thermoplasmata archaeon]|nr:hypothetical protein [Thermoplasmata archaeon]
MAAKKGTKKPATKKKETKKPAPKKATAKKTPSAKKSAPKKAEPKPKPVAEPTLKSLQKTLEKLEKENTKLKEDIKTLKDTGREQKKQLKSLEGKMDTRAKREEVIMATLDISTRTKKGQRSAISDLNRSLIKTDEHLLKQGKRMENVLSAIKNHREYLIRLNKRVYKEDPV